jgi:hypothetical protein
VSIGLEGIPAESRNADGARTAAPAIDGTTFSTYTLSFDKDGGGTVPDVNLTPSTISQAVALPVGTYTVTVTAYVSETAIAEGSAAGVVVADNQNTPVSLIMGPKTGGAQGTLSYSITVPSGVSGELRITTPTGEAVSGVSPVSLTAGQGNTGNKSLDPGYYRVQAALTKGGTSAGHTEVVHIYTGLTSTLTKVFEDGDFEAGGTPDELMGSLGLTISFNYGPITLVEDNGPYTIKKSGTPDSLTLSAPEGYTSIAWYLDGNSTAAGTSNSITLEASALDSKPYSITFIGVKDGKPYSQVITFTVEEGDSESGGDPVSATELADYLKGLSENDVNSPHTVVFASSVDVTGDEWGGTIKDALAAASGKYLILDLRACQAPNNTISGKGYPSGNDFNVIQSEYLVGIMLPSCLTTIGSTALGYLGVNFTSATIPDSVISIGAYAFCDFRGTTITIPQTVTTIGEAAFFASRLTSITIPASVQTIGADAFYSSGRSTFTVIFDGSPSSIDSYAFDGDLDFQGPGTYTLNGGILTKQ